MRTVNATSLRQDLDNFLVTFISASCRFVRESTALGKLHFQHASFEQNVARWATALVDEANIHYMTARICPVAESRSYIVKLDRAALHAMCAPSRLSKNASRSRSSQAPTCLITAEKWRSSEG